MISLAAAAIVVSGLDGGVLAFDGQQRPVIQQAETSAVLSEIRRIVMEKYVVPERRAAIDAVLAGGLSSGRYRTESPALLAERVTQDLLRVSSDRHLYLVYDPERHAAGASRGADQQPDMAAFERRSRERNHGIRRLEVLPGNVRMIELTEFDAVGSGSEEAMNAAMAFLSRGEAVIIDLRNNGGGSGRAVHQAISQFVDPGVPLMTFHRGSEVLPTFNSLPGLSTMKGKPLYVLTSETTGSAAEEFVGHVIGMRLGEVVGANTSGAAYMNELSPIEGGFLLSVSVARPVIASTGRDWERVGYAPTIAARPDVALEVAQAAALRRLAGSAPSPQQRARLQRLAEGTDALAVRATPSVPMNAFAGRYGTYQVIADAGRLWLGTDGRMRRELIPLGGTRFTLVDNLAARIDFRRERGRVSGLTVDLGDDLSDPTFIARDRQV